MSIKTAATLALALISSAAIAGGQGDAACGAGTCGKKEMSASKDADCGAGACAKKDAHCGTKGAEGDVVKADAHCGKKDAECGAGACAKKDTK